MEGSSSIRRTAASEEPLELRRLRRTLVHRDEAGVIAGDQAIGGLTIHGALGDALDGLAEDRTADGEADVAGGPCAGPEPGVDLGVVGPVGFKNEFLVRRLLATPASRRCWA